MANQIADSLELIDIDWTFVFRFDYKKLSFINEMYKTYKTYKRSELQKDK